MGDLINMLPENGRAVLSIVNGVVTAVNVLSSEHHVATLDALIELLRSAGYTVTSG